LAALHQLERVVDLVKRHHMRDHRVDLDLALHVPVDDFRHISVAPRAAEGGAFQTRPVTSWNCRVEISAPAGATPITIDWPQPRWQASSACRITVTLPVQSNV